MENMTISYLIERYKKWVENGNIQFLKKGTREQTIILNFVKDLHAKIKDADGKPGGLSKNLDWHETHISGEKLWKELISFALRDIDVESKGNSKLFGFLSAATDFEDILYGLDPYYRDHTLHSLWVYFIGEYILRDLIPNIYSNLNWYLFINVDPSLREKARDKKNSLCEKVNMRKDAVWCIVALCHDLGYSLSTLDNLNDKVKKVLGFFDIPDFGKIGYSLDIEHQYLISQFLELMAADVRIVPTGDEKDVLVKNYRDDSTYWRLCRALEKKQHGILSSYVIYKLLEMLADTSVRGPAEEWGLDDDEAVDNIIRGDILFAVAQHEFEFAHMNQLSSLADVLFIADELEEFSRFGRPMLSREYHDTMAESKIEFTPTNLKPGNDVEINITYYVATHGSLGDFFVRKAKRLSEIYSISATDQESRDFCTIKNIKMTAEKDGKKVYVQLYRDSERNKVYLPKIKNESKEYQEKEYGLRCIDDKILCIVDKDNALPLLNWFEKVSDDWWKEDVQGRIVDSKKS